MKQGILDFHSGVVKEGTLITREFPSFSTILNTIEEVSPVNKLSPIAAQVFYYIKANTIDKKSVFITTSEKVSAELGTDPSETKNAIFQLLEAKKVTAEISYIMRFYSASL